jgi:hypothetical protein
VEAQEALKQGLKIHAKLAEGFPDLAVGPCRCRRVFRFLRGRPCRRLRSARPRDAWTRRSHRTAASTLSSKSRSR